MSMTITSKILARHANLAEVKPGELINVRVDLVLGNDVGTPMAINEFKKLDVSKVFDPERIYLVPDHFNPSKDIKAAEHVKIMREFARKYKIPHFFETGRMGIEHCLLPELGCIRPGSIVIGNDSHTCTYGALGAFATGVGSTDLAAVMAYGEIWLRVPESIKCIYTGQLQPWVTGKDLILSTLGEMGTEGAIYAALEFIDDTEQKISMDSRFTISNMAVELGAKNGIFAPDAVTAKYLGLSPTMTDENWLASDPTAFYKETKVFNVTSIGPQVACPSSPANVIPVEKVGTVKLDQVVIGGCTNGRLEDLRIAAKLLQNHKIHPNTRLIIIPGTQKILLQAIKEGLIQIFIEAGAAVSTPTCGPCVGGHMGVLAADEVALSTTNRNFVGRMGDPNSQVYLAGPAVAAASAVAGYIVHPEEVAHETVR